MQIYLAKFTNRIENTLETETLTYLRVIELEKKTQKRLWEKGNPIFNWVWVFFSTRNVLISLDQHRTPHTNRDQYRITHHLWIIQYVYRGKRSKCRSMNNHIWITLFLRSTFSALLSIHSQEQKQYKLCRYHQPDQSTKIQFH